VDFPALTHFPFGKGAGVYIPWKPGTLFYKEGYPNTAWFIQDVIEQICGVKGIAPALSPMVELTLSRRPGRIVVQLINTSGHHGNSFYAPLPIRDIGLEVPVNSFTANLKVKNVRTLRGKETLPWSVENSGGGSPGGINSSGGGSFVKLTLPVLEEYEGIIIELEE
jgi:hypothetical protein